MIEEIRAKFRKMHYEYSIHAVDQSVRKAIQVIEVEEAIERGEIIENYPDDKYGPSCLIFGRTNDQRPLHIHCSHPHRERVKIITLYEPDPDQWVSFKFRRVT